jgi:hypothetical protein
MIDVIVEAVTNQIDFLRILTIRIVPERMNGHHKHAEYAEYGKYAANEKPTHGSCKTGAVQRQQEFSGEMLVRFSGVKFQCHDVVP